MDPYEIIIRPIDTEKSRFQSSELGKYTFEVHPGANKIEVKQAVEEIYGADVISVNMLIMPAKINRHGRRLVTRRRAWKKAVVTVAAGQRPDVFEGV
ncbi:MAG TPA: 50S ribosomal protein L23 [Chloroflexi bacterium]|nr:50S ribosomal protein L23 [Chloroflexota bacterium]